MKLKIAEFTDQMVTKFSIWLEFKKEILDDYDLLEWGFLSGLKHENPPDQTSIALFLILYYTWMFSKW